MNKNGETSAALTILLGILIALSALGTDMYVPALPDVAGSYAAPVSAAQLTITTYFLGLALKEVGPPRGVRDVRVVRGEAGKGALNADELGPSGLVVLVEPVGVDEPRGVVVGVIADVGEQPLFGPLTLRRGRARRLLRLGLRWR